MEEEGRWQRETVEGGRVWASAMLDAERSETLDWMCKCLCDAGRRTVRDVAWRRPALNSAACRAATCAPPWRRKRCVATARPCP